MSLKCDEPLWSSYTALEIVGPAEMLPGGDAIVATSEGQLCISPLRNGMRWRIGPQTLPVYPILVDAPTQRLALLERNSEAIVIVWDDFRLALHRGPLAFDLSKAGKTVLSSADDGHFVRQHRLPPFARTPDGWFAAFALHSAQPVYGLGEKWGRLDKRGTLVRSHVLDALGVNSDRAYKNTPFGWSPAAPGRTAVGIFAHTPASVTHGVGYPLWSHRSYGLLVEDEALDFFILAGEGGADILRAYTDLTGRAPLPPRWSLGNILSKAYYRTGDEILAAAREIRAKNMPCETITFDGRAWQDTDTRFHFEFDTKRYADPRPVIAELKALNFRICVWEYPLVSIHGSRFRMMSDKGWLLKDRRSKKPYIYRFSTEPFGKVLTQLPDSGLVDFTHPEAYAYWRDEHKPLYDLGIDMIKSDFGEQVEDDCLAHNGDTGVRLRNVYSLLYNKCVFEAAEVYCKSGAFLFGRAGWAGSQRYPVQWGGDPQSDWEGLAASIRGGLSWGLSGGPFHAHDIGGFYKDQRDPELYVRWTQAAIFFSHLRFHGIGPREPWSYGPEAEAAVIQALVLREKLLPYLWEAVQEATRTGMPVQRAMALAFPRDRAAWSFDEQFMCGPDILVAPALRAGGVVEAYLPHGEWRRLDGAGGILAGGRILELRLELSGIAAFVRPDAIGRVGV